MASLADELAPSFSSNSRRQLDAALPNEQAVRKVYADFGGANGAIRLKQKELLKSAPNDAEARDRAGDQRDPAEGRGGVRGGAQAARRRGGGRAISSAPST